MAALLEVNVATLPRALNAARLLRFKADPKACAGCEAARRPPKLTEFQIEEARRMIDGVIFSVD